MSESTDWRPQTVRRILAPRVDCAYVANEAAAFALGALEPVERVNVERHIRSCDSCAAIVADLEATAGLLPFAAPPAVPTPAAKNALFARIAAAERAPTVAAPQPRPQPQPRPTLVAPLPTVPTLPASTGALADGPAAASQPVVAAAPRPKRWFTMGPSLATIPLVLALALVSVWSLAFREQVQQRAEPLSETVSDGLNTERSETTGAEIDTGDGGVESVLGLDGLDDSSLNSAAEDDLSLDANADLLGYVYGGVDVGTTSAVTANTLQFGDQGIPTGGDVPIS